MRCTNPCPLGSGVMWAICSLVLRGDLAFLCALAVASASHPPLKPSYEDVVDFFTCESKYETPAGMGAEANVGRDVCGSIDSVPRADTT